MYPTQDEIIAYITQAALARGMDPRTAITVASGEGLNARPQEGWQSFVPNKNGPNGREDSWSVYQLLKSHNGKPMGVGHQMLQQTGLDPADPANWQASIDYALDYAAKNGWSAWYGAKAKGVSKWEGINGAHAIGLSQTPAENSATQDTPGNLQDTADVQNINILTQPGQFSPQVSPPQDTQPSGYDAIVQAYRQQLAANTPKPRVSRSETFDIIKY